MIRRWPNNKETIGLALSVTQRAEATARVYPITLNQIIHRAQRHVIGRAVRSSLHNPERPRALVSVFLTARVVPGVQVRISNRLFMIIETNDDFTFERKSKMDVTNIKVQKWEQLMWHYQ